MLAQTPNWVYSLVLCSYPFRKGEEEKAGAYRVAWPIPCEVRCHQGIGLLINKPAERTGWGRHAAFHELLRGLGRICLSSCLY
jgi:hypothetical protein